MYWITNYSIALSLRLWAYELIDSSPPRHWGPGTSSKKLPLSGAASVNCSSAAMALTPPPAWPFSPTMVTGLSSFGTSSLSLSAARSDTPRMKWNSSGPPIGLWVPSTIGSSMGIMTNPRRRQNLLLPRKACLINRPHRLRPAQFPPRRALIVNWLPSRAKAATPKPVVRKPRSGSKANKWKFLNQQQGARSFQKHESSRRSLHHSGHLLLESPLT